MVCSMRLYHSKKLHPYYFSMLQIRENLCETLVIISVLSFSAMPARQLSFIVMTDTVKRISPIKPRTTPTVTSVRDKYEGIKKQAKDFYCHHGISGYFHNQLNVKYFSFSACLLPFGLSVCLFFFVVSSFQYRLHKTQQVSVTL